MIKNKIFTAGLRNGFIFVYSVGYPRPKPASFSAAKRLIFFSFEGSVHSKWAVIITHHIPHNTGYLGKHYSLDRLGTLRN